MEAREQEAVAQRLLGIREELLAEARERSGQAAELQDTAGVADAGDASTIDERTELLDTLNDRDRERVMAIDDALHRLRQGTYGRCEGCGNQISKKRLEAQPQARFCLDCQEDREREKALRAGPTQGKI